MIMNKRNIVKRENYTKVDGSNFVLKITHSQQW